MQCSGTTPSKKTLVLTQFQHVAISSFSMQELYKPNTVIYSVLACGTHQNTKHSSKSLNRWVFRAAAFQRPKQECFSMFSLRCARIHTLLWFKVKSRSLSGFRLFLHLPSNFAVGDSTWFSCRVGTGPYGRRFRCFPGKISLWNLVVSSFLSIPNTVLKENW